MSWEVEQDRLTQQARLYLSSPEVVFEELKRQARKAKHEIFTQFNENLEAALINRNERLINLGLACYCGNREVFKALYNHSLSAPQDDGDARYKNGLRVGCLSNQVLTKAHILVDFPSGLIGLDETRRILTAGEDAETAALLRNPSVSEKLLESLYSYTGAFAGLDEERWCQLVAVSSKNERLTTEYEYYDSPDMEHYSIHKAIFRLLEIAPVRPMWVRVLYDLLIALDYQQVASPDSIDGALARWAQLEDKDRDGKPFEGYYTSIPLKDEFRCLIAAMYGRGFTKSKTIMHGSLHSQDVAGRCAFYGKGEITAKDMKAGHKRDKDVFAFAALFNDRVYSRTELRALYEEEYARGDLYRLFERNYGFKKKKWQQIDSRFDDKKPAAEDSSKPLIELQGSVEALTKTVAGFAGQFADARKAAIIIGIALAVLIYWTKH